MTSDKIWLKTKRLSLIHPNENNIKFYRELLRNNEVTKFIYNYKGEEDISKDLDLVLNQYKNHGYSIGPLFKNNEFIGRAGFFNRHYQNQEFICLTYLLLPQFWQQGYGFEIVDALINYGFNKLNNSEILVYINILNKPSISLIKKFNPKLVGKSVNESGNFNIYIIKNKKRFRK